MKLQYQKHLLPKGHGKKWDELTHTQKIAEVELAYSDNVRLGYWTEDRFNQELQDKINLIINN